MKPLISIIVSVLIASVSADSSTLYTCRVKATQGITFQDFPCAKETLTVYVGVMPKANTLESSESNNGGQNVPIGYWQSRIGKVSHLQNPVENISLPTLNKVPSLSGSGFIKKEDSDRN